MDDQHDKMPGDATAPETDRRGFMKTAATVGVVGVAGAIHGKYASAPLRRQASCRADRP